MYFFKLMHTFFSMIPKGLRNYDNNSPDEHAFIGSTLSHNIDTMTASRRTIVGGIFSELYRYPYMVTLQYKFGRYAHTHVCGASLIAPDIILSAAHCYESSWGTPQVIIGDYDMLDNSDSTEVFDVELIAFHPDWSFDYNGNPWFLNDLILFKISNGEQSTKQPIRLNSNPNIPSPSHNRDKLVVMGWGATEYGAKSNILKETTLEHQPDFMCFSSFPDQNIDPSILLCAQDLDGEVNEDSCRGDSGGPIIVKGDSPSQDLQVGLVSSGPMPCAQDKPGYYTEISYFYDWIQQHTCNSSVSPPSYFQCSVTPSLTPGLRQIPTMQPSSLTEPTLSKVPITIAIRGDRNPEDISWTIHKSQIQGGELVYSRDPGTYDSYQYYLDFIYETIYLNKNDTYVFTISDSNGDGICCSKGYGYYFVYYGTKNEKGHFQEDKRIFWNIGEFKSSTSHFFTTADPKLKAQPVTSLSSSEDDPYITIQLMLRQFPFYVSWDITSAADNDRKMIVQKPKASYVVSSKQLITEVVHLPPSIPFTFIIKSDRNGRTGTVGYVKVFEGSVHDQKLLFERRNTFEHDSFNFTLEDKTLSPSTTPSIQPSVMPSIQIRTPQSTNKTSSIPRIIASSAMNNNVYGSFSITPIFSIWIMLSYFFF